MYTDSELHAIREAFPAALTWEQQKAMNKKGMEEEVDPAVLPFLILSESNPDLFEKLKADEKIKRHTMFGFFPIVFDWIYEQGKSPEITFSTYRGLSAVVEHESQLVRIKAAINPREPEIAKTAGELGIGPKQYESARAYLTEEVVDGIYFSRLPENRRTKGDLVALGMRVGEIFTVLHENHIFYNDMILSDDFMNSHLLIPNSGKAILTDFKGAMRVDGELDDGAVFDYARTMPAVKLALEMGGTSAVEIVASYRGNLMNLAPKQMMNRDLAFIHEGLFCASVRWDQNIGPDFLRGFNESYKSPV